MATIKTFELDRWSEPDAQRRVRHLGMADAQETFDRLEAHLRENDLLPDEYFLRSDIPGELPDFDSALCVPNFGGSEGIYLDISLVCRGDDGKAKFVSFATGKTLAETGDAFLRMHRIAAECSLLLNGRGQEYTFTDRRNDKMKTVPREWITFMREQYPEGSRVTLCEMKDPFDPVEPGSTGRLDRIDDAGTFHVSWDNGRTLGLIVGEDRFSVRPPAPALLRLYMPMTADCYMQNEWGDLENEPNALDSREAARYADSIAAALGREFHPEEAERGLMKYYRADDGVNRRVQSLRFSAEVRGGRLWGVADCMIEGTLTPEELERLKDYVSGQASDGFGEGFEQREIKVEGGSVLYAHLWSSENWSLKTEAEQFGPKLAEGLPELCFSTLPVSGELICIRRGESGYCRSDWSTPDRERNLELADFHNARLGVTPEQRQAMEVGSMAGWNVPGANPQAYRTGGMTLA